MVLPFVVETDITLEEEAFVVILIFLLTPVLLMAWKEKAEIYMFPLVESVETWFKYSPPTLISPLVV